MRQAARSRINHAEPSILKQSGCRDILWSPTTGALRRALNPCFAPTLAPSPCLPSIQASVHWVARSRGCRPFFPFRLPICRGFLHASTHSPIQTTIWYLAPHPKSETAQRSGTWEPPSNDNSSRRSSKRSISPPWSFRLSPCALFFAPAPHLPERYPSPKLRHATPSSATDLSTPSQSPAHTY